MGVLNVKRKIFLVECHYFGLFLLLFFFLKKINTFGMRGLVGGGWFNLVDFTLTCSVLILSDCYVLDV